MKVKADAHSNSIARLLLSALIAAVGLMACGGGGGSAGAGGQMPAPPPEGLVAVTVDVHPTMVMAPLDRARMLAVPPGLKVRALARVPGARFMRVLPTGDVLVSQPGSGRIVLVRPTGDATSTTSTFASGLRSPHDMVLVNLSGVWWLYVAESHRVTRAVYNPGDTTIGTMQTVVDGLPDSSTPELRGAYAHALKNIAVSAAGTLYVSIASSCNACESDVNATPVRGAVYRYDADGANGRLYARGIRNAEGLDFLPGTDQLWAVVNHRDQIAYPFDNDFDGDGASDLGRVMPAYVQTNPPEPFIRVRDGANHGWPYCNPVANGSMTDLELVADHELNRDQSRLACSTVPRVEFGIAAHSAPLGLSFLQGTPLPAALSSGAAVALHGCWNCTAPVGYKVVAVRFDGQGRPVGSEDLLTGFVGQTTASAWGRPVDVAAHPQRASMLVSDDLGGVIYEVYAQ
ncbi:MAG TPA: sugar dehydrogenase [Burkholderiaceae bacterium]|nr:sugar dehydrogenase [Burkholderiaceae bacterium]